MNVNIAWQKSRSSRSLNADEVRLAAAIYRYSEAIYVVVDSLPEPYQSSFWKFLRGSAIPIADGKNRYAYVQDFERWIGTIFEVG